MLDSDGNIGIELCLMMEVLAVPSVRKVCTRTAHQQIAWAVFSSMYQSTLIASAFLIICVQN